MEKEIEKLQELIDGYDNIVFFGGAGVSTESGIPDFRLKCQGCGHQIMVPRKMVEKNTKNLQKKEK